MPARYNDHMNDPTVPPLEAILRFCQTSAPNPWYPAAFVRETGFPREQLDPLLNEMRVNGLIRLTDWVSGNGQGYVLTPAGEQAMQNPRLLARLRAGQMPIIVSNVPEPRALRHETGTAWARHEAARDALLGSFTPIVTYVLIFANLAVFGVGMALAINTDCLDSYLSGSGNDAAQAVRMRTGYLTGAAVYVRGEWWRLISACFDHIGWMHLAVNMYSLFAVGPLIERLWGSGRFLILYFLAGIAGSCGVLIENPAGGGAGASGALWGILASLAAWIYLNRKALPPRLITDWRRQLLIVFLLNVFITFSVKHISKGGHFGGGLIGLIAAIPLDYLKLGTPAQRHIALVGLIGIPVICIGIVVRSFQYTGPLLRLAEANNEAKTLLRQLQANTWKGSRRELVTSVSTHQTKLSEAMQMPVPRPPVWLPSQEKYWALEATEAQSILGTLISVQAQLRNMPVERIP